MEVINPTSAKCYEVLFGLCKAHLENTSTWDVVDSTLLPNEDPDPMQMSGLSSMMWQNNLPVELNIFRQDDSWMSLLSGQNTFSSGFSGWDEVRTYLDYDCYVFQAPSTWMSILFIFEGSASTWKGSEFCLSYSNIWGSQSLVTRTHNSQIWPKCIIGIELLHVPNHT